MTSQENTKLIPLTQGKFAIVDAEEFDHLMQWKWYFSQGYALRQVNPNKSDGRKYQVSMHRYVNGTPVGMDTDHINGNKLDNRKCNLRSCTRQQNQFNKGPQKNKRSIYKGVYLLTCHQKYYYWIARININGKRIHIGSFKTEGEAASAYNKAASELYGYFAKLNVI